MTRRTYGIGVVGALALLALVLPVVALVSALGADPPAPPRSDVDRAYAISGELTCDTDVTQLPVVPLDAEPLAMLVCARDDSSMPWTAPTDLVEGDLSRLRDVLDGLEEAPVEDVACTMQAGWGYDLVLRFSRDRYARIEGDTAGCGFVTLGVGRWYGASEVLETALALVEEQREGQDAPTALPPVPDCPADDPPTPYSLTGSAADMVVAVSCWRPDARELPPFRGPVRVPSAALAVLTADLERRAEPLGDPGRYDCPGGDDALYAQSLVGRTAWGDLVSVDGWCHELVARRPLTAPDHERPLAWYPSPRAQRILDGLRR